MVRIYTSKAQKVFPDRLLSLFSHQEINKPMLILSHTNLLLAEKHRRELPRSQISPDYAQSAPAPTSAHYTRASLSRQFYLLNCGQGRGGEVVNHEMAPQCSYRRHRSRLFYLLFHLILFFYNPTRTIAAVLQFSETLSVNQAANSSKSTFIQPDHPSNISAVSGDVWKYYCTALPTWFSSSYNPDDCVWAVELLYHEEMGAGGRWSNEFLAKGAKSVTRNKSQRTPRTYVFGMRRQMGDILSIPNQSPSL